MHNPTLGTIGQHLATLLISAAALTPLAQGQVVNEDMKFLPTTFAAGDEFGRAVAMDNGIIAVGVTGDDENGPASGSVYLFDATTGNQLLKLLPSSGAAGDNFGISVAIDNGIAIIGAFLDDDFGTDRGSAYLFDVDPLSPGFGNELLQLNPLPHIMAGDWFGWSVAIDNGIAVVGSPAHDGNGFSNSGSASFYDADPLSLGFGTHLTDVYSSSPNPTDEEIGSAVAISNGIVAVGAVGDDTNGPYSGAVYLYETNGNQRAKLIPTGNIASDAFGLSISIDNGIAAIGARGNHSAYLFDVAISSPTFGDQLAELTPTSGLASDQFGYSISIDNGIAAVGAQYNDDNATNAGAAYLFDADPGSPLFGTQLAKLLPIGGAANDWFGSAIAIDNGIIAVGAHRDDDFGTNSGSVFTFNTAGAQQAQLAPTSSFDEFGWAIATDNGIVAVGAMQDSTNGPDAGAVYLYDECSGNLLIKLFPAGAAADDWFGCSVSLANGYLVAGAWGDDTNGLNAGAAYVFNADPNSPDFGNQISKLLPAGGVATDYFGVSVAIDKNSVVGFDPIVVGAWGDDTNGSNAGAAYVFDIFGFELAKFFPTGGLPNDHFGNSISIDNGIVAIGAWGDDVNGVDSGSAYVFDATGIELAQLLPSVGTAAAYFGSSIDIDDGVIAVGEYSSSAAGLLFSGAAYLFDTSGIELAMLVPNNAAQFDSFGVSISIDNNVVVVGANRTDDNGPDSGAAYLFHADPNRPNIGIQMAKLLPTDGQSNDDFGRSVSISGQSIAIGAIWDDDTGTDNGSAYAFKPCPADLNGDWTNDFLDISIFLNGYNSGAALADLNCDGALDFLDISKFLAAYASSCP